MKIPNSKIGHRKDLGRSFRSTWEANYARMLNYEDKKWSYEEHKFPFYDEYGKIICVYTPDFFVDDEFIELKGHADGENDWTCDCKRCERDRIRIKLFAENYPDKILKIFGRKEYREMAAKYNKIIQGWEKTNRG